MEAAISGAAASNIAAIKGDSSVLLTFYITEGAVLEEWMPALRT